MGNAVTNPGRFIEKKVFGVPRSHSRFVSHDAVHHYHTDPAALEQQLQQVEEVKRQLEQQRQEREEMLHQLHKEETARALENQQFQNELKRMKEESDTERAHHEQQMQSMETEALRSRLLQVGQHIHDLQNELMRSENAYDAVKRQLDDKAIQVHQEKTKISHFEFERNDPSVKNIVVLGMTGDGKSTLCNRLCGDGSEFGENGPFVVSSGIDSETIVVSKQIYEHQGVRISVVDTPGIADSESRDREHVNNVISYLRGSSGVNQFLLVKSIGNPRFNSHYREMLREFEHFLGEGFWRFVTVVLTSVESHNKRKFASVKHEVVRQLAEDHPVTRNHEVPVVGIGFEDYEGKLIHLVTNVIPQDRYQCEYLTSPLEDLEAELEGLRTEAEEAFQEVEKTRQRLGALSQQKTDIEQKLS